MAFGELKELTSMHKKFQNRSRVRIYKNVYLSYKKNLKKGSGLDW